MITLIIVINLHRLQEEYQPTDDTTQTEEEKEEQAAEALRKEKKLLFSNPAFLSAWSGFKGPS